jgi:hypothetical protein
LYETAHVHLQILNDTMRTLREAEAFTVSDLRIFRQEVGLQKTFSAVTAAKIAHALDASPQTATSSFGPRQHAVLSAPPAMAPDTGTSAPSPAPPPSSQTYQKGSWDSSMPSVPVNMGRAVPHPSSDFVPLPSLPAPSAGWSFVANVGLPRTGTTSFALAGALLGMRSRHSWCQKYTSWDSSCGLKPEAWLKPYARPRLTQCTQLHGMLCSDGAAL